VRCKISGGLVYEMRGQWIPGYLWYSVGKIVAGKDGLKLDLGKAKGPSTFLLGHVWHCLCAINHVTPEGASYLTSEQCQP
jgi:hypothetical protein